MTSACRKRSGWLPDHGLHGKTAVFLGDALRNHPSHSEAALENVRFRTTYSDTGQRLLTLRLDLIRDGAICFRFPSEIEAGKKKCSELVMLWAGSLALSSPLSVQAC